MLKHIGEEHPGHITSVHPFGFFVELDTLFIEGMVHVASLHDAYYRFDDELKRLIGEGTSSIYATGSPVTVTVRDVNVARREIDLSVKKTAAPEKKRADLKKLRKRIK
jgi:ribonuclease R